MTIAKSIALRTSGAAVSTALRPAHKAPGARRVHMRIVCACARICVPGWVPDFARKARFHAVCHDAGFCRVARGTILCNTQHMPLHTMQHCGACSARLCACARINVLRGATMSALLRARCHAVPRRRLLLDGA